MKDFKKQKNGSPVILQTDQLKKHCWKSDQSKETKSGIHPQKTKRDKWNFFPKEWKKNKHFLEISLTARTTKCCFKIGLQRNSNLHILTVSWKVAGTWKATWFRRVCFWCRENWNPSVDDSEIRRENQLRLVAYLIIYRVLNSQRPSGSLLKMCHPRPLSMTWDFITNQIKKSCISSYVQCVFFKRTMFVETLPPPL